MAQDQAGAVSAQNDWGGQNQLKIRRILFRTYQKML